MDFESHLRLLQASNIPATTLAILREQPICRAAFRLIVFAAPTAIVNHSARVFVLAHRASQAAATRYTRPDLLYAGSMLHDLGATGHCGGTQRFEVEGADAAAALLREHHCSQAECDEVWRAVALHTTPGIAERMAAPTNLLRHAVLVDFRTQPADGEAEALAQGAEKHFPRLEIERCLGDAVVALALTATDRRKKAPPASWPGVLVAAHLADPHHEGVNPAF